MKRTFLVWAFLWAHAAAAQYYNDFESWPIMGEGYWNLSGPGGYYGGYGVYVNFGNESSGLRKVGFNDVGDALELPPVTNPTSVSFWARLSSGSGAGIAVEYYDDRFNFWLTAGSAYVTSTSYEYFVIDIFQPQPWVGLRLVMTSYGNSVFLDDLGVDAAPLPVELTAFDAAYLPGRGVELRWETATETGNAYFEVERGVDGAAFDVIGRVPGHGTSQAPLRYAFLDAAPPAGRLYYRLRQVDHDGEATRSDVRSVVAPASAPGLRLASTVVRDELLLLPSPSPRTRRLRIVDAAGRVVHAATVPAGATEWAAPATHLRAGIYVAALEEGGGVLVRRFVKE